MPLRGFAASDAHLWSGLALKPVGRMGGAPHRKRIKTGGIGGGILGLRIQNIALIQCDKVVL